MEAIADKVIGGLGSLASKELELLCNFQDDLDCMKSTVSAIKAALRDAEAKATKSQLLSDWLEKLKDVLLDTEDLLDAYSTEELAREVMTKDKMVKEVRIFFSKSNRIARALKMGHKIKAIKKKLDDIVVEKNNFQLNENSLNVSVKFNERRQTHSFVREGEVVGRDKEKTRLVSFLLGSDVKDNVIIVPIFGIGGLGKTTLAQQVYNDKVVQNHFEEKIWVCVSDEFSIKKLVQKIIGQEKNGEVEQLAQDLRKKIEGKLFLLVLDDVWNEDRELWLKLKTLLVGGRKGSMIIVTTRSEEVVKIMGTHPPIFLKNLDLENSWKLFHQVVFEDGKEPNNPALVDIGKDIVKKCAGVPLVIRTIGSLLFSRKLEVSEWSYFRDNELAKIDLEENKIFSILKLSYDHLPSHLKICFGFCSLFPKDYVIERKTLIQLWMAEGFIQPLDQNRCLEDVGHEYFMKLLSRCLFQDVTLDKYGDIKFCKMHDFIHDLARLVTKNECYIMTRERIKEENFGDRIRHVSSDVESQWKFPTCNVKTKKVRTIVSPNRFCEIIPSHLPPLRSHDPICGSTTSFPRQLRVLDFSRVDREIPKSIGELKHLRYLDLSWNKTIEKLPQEITKLHNLQSLKLDGCVRLKELPRNVNKMVSLRHLELDYCDSLICMPRGLGRLTHLQTLKTFVVDNSRRSSGARISELHELNNLKGTLKITNLERQRNNTKEVEHVKLLVKKPYLQELMLCWLDNEVEGNECQEQVGQKDEIILEALELHHTIKRLYIFRFCGKWLSEWIGNVTSLQELKIYNCFVLASLPKSIGNLTSLQDLSLDGGHALASLPESIGNLTSLQHFRLNDCPTLASLLESIGNLMSLQDLELTSCPTLASLSEAIGNLTSLQHLRLKDCPALASLPESIGNLTSLERLTLHGCLALASLPETIRNLTTLQHLRLNNCLALTSLLESIGNFMSLQHLTLYGCPALASLPESIGNLMSLQHLTLHGGPTLALLPELIGNLMSLQDLELNCCSTLASLPESIGNLTLLQHLTLCFCPALESLPETIGNLTSLQHLRLDNCLALASLPESIGNLMSLQHLTFHGCPALASLPESIGNLMSLQHLTLYGGLALASLPETIGNLTSLQHLTLCGGPASASLPEPIGNLTSLQYLMLPGYPALASRPESIKNLTHCKVSYL